MKLQYQSILEAVPCAVLVISRADGVVRFLNQQAEKLFGYPCEQLCGSCLEILIPEEHGRLLFQDSDPPIGKLELTCRHRDGSVLPVEFSVKVQQGDDPSLLVCIAYDPSAPRHADGVGGPGLAADSNINSRPAFASKMGHELRTPLNAILGYSDMYIEDPDEIDADEFLSDLVKIHSAALYLLALIDETVDLAKDETTSHANLDADKVIARAKKRMAAAEEHRGVSEVAASASLASITGAKILLVEDHILNQELAMSLLTDAGLKVTLAENGQQALEMLENNKFDGVLMDIHMPVLDGYAATRTIREQARFADLPVIAMTAGATDEDKAKASNAGMDGFIAKPLDMGQALETIARCLNRR